MLDVLLANAPVNKRTKHSRMNPPLGLAYIASVLRQNGFGVSAEDFNVSNFTEERVAGLVERRHPRVLGISSTTETYLNGLKIAEIAKQVDPEIKVVMGGPHVSVLFQEVAQEKAVDVVVRGEGEFTMLELAGHLIRNEGSIGEIKGIAFERDGVVAVTPQRDFVCDVDSLPIPARELFPLPMYQQPAQVLMSRGGCPFNCVFCSVNNIWHGQRRFRSTDNVIEEIRSISQDTGLGDIGFSDDTFTLNRSRVLDLCQKAVILRDEFSWAWSCTTRVDLVDPALLTAMRDAGCYRVTYGVETGAQEVLDRVGKRITLDQVRRATGSALDQGMSVLCSFMFPHPWDTEETIREQAAFMRELVDMGAMVTMALTTPFPGTEYYRKADDLGIRILTDRWDEYDAKHLIIETRALPEARLKSLLAELIDHVGLAERFDD